MQYDIRTINTKLKGILTQRDSIIFPKLRGHDAYTARVSKSAGYYLSCEHDSNNRPLQQYLGGIKKGYKIIKKLNRAECHGTFPEVTSLAILTLVVRLIARKGRWTKDLLAECARAEAAAKAKEAKALAALTDHQTATYRMLRKHHARLGCNKPAVVDLLQAVLGCTFPESVNEPE